MGSARHLQDLPVLFDRRRTWNRERRGERIYGSLTSPIVLPNLRHLILGVSNGFLKQLLQNLVAPQLHQVSSITSKDVIEYDDEGASSKCHPSVRILDFQDADDQVIASQVGSFSPPQFPNIESIIIPSKGTLFFDAVVSDSAKNPRWTSFWDSLRTITTTGDPYSREEYLQSIKSLASFADARNQLERRQNQQGPTPLSICLEASDVDDDTKTKAALENLMKKVSRIQIGDTVFNGTGAAMVADK